MKVSIYCPHCLQQTALSVATATCRSCNKDTAPVYHSGSNNFWWIGICNYCDEAVLVYNNGERVYPHPYSPRADERIPEDIRNDIDEAKNCFNIGAYRASTVMARRAIQSTCLAKGTGKGDLVTQINELKTKGVITDDIKEWATLVRWVGNDAAHPNKGEIYREDADDILHLAEQFLHVIFVAPAIAKDRLELRKK